MFGEAKLTENAAKGSFRYISYVIGFDSSSTFPLSNDTWFVKNVNFAVNNSSSVHVDKRKKDIVVLGKDPYDELDNTAM